MNKKIVKIIALIPAKKNSRELKNKNLKKLNDLTLVEIAIINAKKSKFINEIYLSSDSNKILDIGKNQKINVIKRKKYLSTHNTSANALILDFIKNKSNNIHKDCILIYLQPTSPFRNINHIDQAIRYFLSKKLRSLLSVTENKNFFKTLIKNKLYLKPYFTNDFVSTNRQNFQNTYSPNGAIYIFYVRDFIKNKKLTFYNSGYYLMNKIDSIDIDDKKDYELAVNLSHEYLKIKK